MGKVKTTKKTANLLSDEYALPPCKSLVLRTCDYKLQGYHGFQWPMSGPVEAPDWNTQVRCGGGLHGLLWGEGSGSLLNFDDGAKWLVVEVDTNSVIDLTPVDGSVKVKFPRGIVVHCGDRNSAPKFIAEHGGVGRSIVSGTSNSGDRGTSTSGDSGTSNSGFRGTSTSGDRGTSTSGDSGTSNSGFRGTSTSGDRGTSTSGFRGTSTSGDSGTSKSGEIGIVVCRWFDKSKNRYRLSVGYVGEDGIEPNAFYKCDETGKLIKVTS
jgi:hypothetical protein